MPSGLKHQAAIGKAARAKGTPTPRGVQGIASNLDDLTLRGEKWKDAIGDALAEGTLTRKIVGATELTMEVHDPGRHLLRHPLMGEAHEVSLDGLHFGFVKAASEGKDAPMSLTYEPRLVVALREIMGPHKAARAKQTRAEFCQRRVYEVEPRPKFVCPELHVKQPVASAREAAEVEERNDQERRKGIGDEHPAKLTVKGNAATPAQRQLGERALAIAAEDSAPEKVMLSLIEALIVETEMGALDPDNPLQATPASKSGSTESDIHRYLTGGWGVDPTGNGAIGYYKQNPEASAGTIAQAIQGSAFGGRYDEYGEEAQAWLGAHGGAGVASVEFKKYEYRQAKDESNWKVINRLASEVNWRCFESAGVIYFMVDDDLLESRVRFGINDSTPSVVDTTFDLDIGKDADEMTVEAYAKPWAAPPGSVVAIGRHGPADGLWLVERIEAPLNRRNSLCQITLKRPTEPKPEPAPKSEKRRLGGGASGSGTAGGVGGMGRLEGTPEEIVNQAVDWANANGFPDVTRETVRAANAAHSTLTSSGSISDHKGPPQTAWAADISNGSSPTPEMNHLAAAIAKAFGIPWSGAGLVTHVSGNYQLQLIYKAAEHYDHVHFGCHAI